MGWRGLQIAACGTHHLDASRRPAYAARFEEVLKFHEPGLAPVRLGGLAWHVRSDGTAAYPRRFVRTFGFYEGLAAVVAADGWHHVTTEGNETYLRRHAWAGNFQYGRCPVRDFGGAYFHITPTGDDAYAQRWRYAGDYRDGIAVVQEEDGYSSHIGLDGSLVHGQWFVDLDVFHKGFARARDEDGWTHIDMHGRPGYARRFQAVEPFYNGQARVERFDGALEVIDQAGMRILELRAPRMAAKQVLGTKVLLAGLPGAGKTTIGAGVGSRLGIRVHRLDDFRASLSDGTIAGDYLARAAFLRACSQSGPAVYEFSAAGYHRIAVRQAFRESGDRLLVAWVDTPQHVRHERLSKRETSVPLPDWGIVPGANDAAMEDKLRSDFSDGWWNRQPGWTSLRLDGCLPVEDLVEVIVRMVLSTGAMS